MEDTTWIESAYEHFTNAVESGNYALAKDVIADCLDSGFKAEADAMTIELRETSVSKFNE